MTVIVWDGKTLAADKQATNSGLKMTVTKIKRINEDLFGVTGDFDLAQSTLKWFADGADPEKFPKHQETDDKWVGLVRITPDKRILKYERSPFPMDYTQMGKMAWGSGRDYALAAMAMGADAVKAVEVACQFESTCGLGVDFLTHEGE
jgi:ATP-dependent protease HslVU (ClpYQ) peptidase subunit